ncbi:MAG: CinA family nicotinamide mononucleotide deamidase-related protein [Bacteroidales bacterium]
MNITYIAIGSELLKGRIINTNLTKAGEMLRSVGLDLTKSMEIPDTKAAILSALSEEMERAEVLIFSGGLGPTSDDITKKTLAAFFGKELVYDMPALARLEKWFGDRGRVLSETNKMQALVPEGCTVLPNVKGTAQGMLFQMNQNGQQKYIFSLPGVPHEMLYLLEYEVIPVIQQHFTTQYIQNHIFRLWGIAESDVADKLAHLEAQFPPQLDLSYLPRIDGLWLELTFRGDESEKEQAIETLAHFKDLIRKEITKYLYIEGKLPIEKELNAYFLEKKLTLAIAESMTGGGIAGKLVTISGASAFLKGGMVTYMTETKVKQLKIPAKLIKEKGVASPEVAQAMAEAVRKKFNADIGLASTGFAEADEQNKMPYVWLGYADETHSDSRQDFFFYDRTMNIERAVAAALVFLWRKLVGSL